MALPQPNVAILSLLLAVGSVAGCDRVSTAVGLGGEVERIEIAGGTLERSGGLEQWQLPTFFMDRTEVTVGEFRACVQAGKCKAPATGDDCNGDTNRSDHPINCVEYEGAQAYCQWKGKFVPTSMQWKWAAQGREEVRRFPWGEELPSCDLAVIDDRSRGRKAGQDATAGCGEDGTWPVGSKPKGASRDGVLDLVGNVAEWTSSPPFGRDDPGQLPVIAGSGWFGGSGLEVVHEVSEVDARPSGEPGPRVGFRCAADGPG